MSDVAKLLFFPKPAPAPIYTVERIITLSIGSERYAMTMQTKIERVTAQPMGKPSLDFQRDRELESRKLAPAQQRGDPDAERTAGPEPRTPGAELSLGGNAAPPPASRAPHGSAAEANTARAKSETMQNTTSNAPEPVATVGAQAPDVAPRAGKTSKKATRSE